MFELSQMEPMLCCGCGLVLSIQLLLECILFFFSFFGFFWVVFGEHFLVMCALYAVML
jgi:hypothetical protein